MIIEFFSNYANRRMITFVQTKIFETARHEEASITRAAHVTISILFLEIIYNEIQSRFNFRIDWHFIRNVQNNLFDYRSRVGLLFVFVRRMAVITFGSLRNKYMKYFDKLSICKCCRYYKGLFKLVYKIERIPSFFLSLFQVREIPH